MTAVVAAVGAGLCVLAAATALAWWRRGRARRSVRRRLAPAPRARRSALEAVVGRLSAPVGLQDRLDDAAVALDAGAVWRAGALAVVAGVPLAALLGGLGLAVALAALLGGVPTLALWALAGRADGRLEAALPDVLEQVAGALRSGTTLRRALAEVAAAVGDRPARLGDDLAAVVHDVDTGMPLVAALDAWAERRPLPAVRLAVAALALGAETGGAHARAVDGVAATVRSRLAVSAEVRALSSQARLSGLVIALAPVGFGLLAAVTDPRTASFLFRTTPGLVCLALGLALDAVAAAWMHRLTGGAR